MARPSLESLFADALAEIRELRKGSAEDDLAERGDLFRTLLRDSERKKEEIARDLSVTRALVMLQNVRTTFPGGCRTDNMEVEGETIVTGATGVEKDGVQVSRQTLVELCQKVKLLRAGIGVLRADVLYLSRDVEGSKEWVLKNLEAALTNGEMEGG